MREPMRQIQPPRCRDSRVGCSVESALASGYDASQFTMEFGEEGSATRIILTQEFLKQPPDLEDRDWGWRSSLDRLDEDVADEQG